MEALTARSVVSKRKPERISTTLRDTLRVQFLLSIFRLDNLFFRQVSLPQVIVQLLEVLSGNDVCWVNDVAERFRHLPSVRVSDHRVTEYLFERHLSGKLVAEEDHSGDPKEQDIPSGLEDRVGIEVLEILGLQMSMLSEPSMNH